MPRELSPEDVIDEVVLRAYREFVREPEWRRTATWLERLTREQLETECRRLEGERERSIQFTAWSKLVSIWTGLVRRASEPRRAHAETTAAPCQPRSFDGGDGRVRADYSRIAIDELRQLAGMALSPQPTRGV